MGKKPLLGISVGDPGGIGPEITIKALALEEMYAICRPLVVSDFGLMEDALRIANAQLELNKVSRPAEGRYEFGCIDVLDMHNVDMSKLVHKKVTAENTKEEVEIEVGKTDWTYTEVTSGLEQGDKIVVNEIPEAPNVIQGDFD